MPNPVIDNGERRINEAVCIDTKRIYDSCVSKDCLEDLRVTFPATSQELIDRAVSVKSKCAVISAVSIDVDEVPFEHGYYTVEITYYFTLTFDTYQAPCTLPETAIGYTSFSKKCILYGSDGNVKVFVSNTLSELTDCPEAPQYTNPSAKVQAVDPVVLSVDVYDICNCRVPKIMSFPNSVADASIFANNRGETKAVLVTLGLFSIVQMERDIQVTIPAYDYCIPEKECNCNTANPCETFANIDFPINEFFPKDEENCDNPCCNS